MSWLVLPVFPGRHAICRPATFHGLEPPPVLPSLGKRARIELALLVEHSGIEPLIWLGFNHDLSFTGLMPLNGGSSRIQTYASNPIQVSVISLYHGSLFGPVSPGCHHSPLQRGCISMSLAGGSPS